MTCCLERVAKERRQKNTALKKTTVKEEDPYGGSTDENTDAEAEEDHPIPELPGTSVYSYQFLPVLSKELMFLRQTLQLLTPNTLKCIPLFVPSPFVKNHLVLCIVQTFSVVLPDFLSRKHFFLYGKFPNNERRLLLRYIVAFNG